VKNIDRQKIRRRQRERKKSSSWPAAVAAAAAAQRRRQHQLRRASCVIIIFSHSYEISDREGEREEIKKGEREKRREEKTT
jgi:hypothetical protein